MKKFITMIVAASLFPAALTAAPATFDFKDPKGVNNAIFKMDAPLEAINGSATGITGKVTFDPANPGASQGKIVIATSSLHVGNPVMKEHMHSDKWLDVAKHPEITFETKEVKNVKTTGDTTTADVVGTFTLKGVSKELTLPVKVTYLKDKLSARMPNAKGDLLVLRTTFTIKRSDFNINPGQFEDKVSNDIELSLSIAGASPK